MCNVIKLFLGIQSLRGFLECNHQNGVILILMCKMRWVNFKSYYKYFFQKLTISVKFKDIALNFNFASNGNNNITNFERSCICSVQNWKWSEVKWSICSIRFLCYLSFRDISWSLDRLHNSYIRISLALSIFYKSGPNENFAISLTIQNYYWKLS